MRSDTQAIDIAAPADRVFAFVSDGAKLPLWTLGFITSAEPLGNGRWLVNTRRGRETWAVDAHRLAGTVDWHTSLPPAPPRISYGRVLPCGARGATFIFTIVQWPEIGDARFGEMRATVREELGSAKLLLERGGL